MKGSITLLKSLRNKKKSQGSEEDERMLLGSGLTDEEDEEESYYEEVIVDEDGEEYIEEILDDSSLPPPTALTNLPATAELINNMNLQGAKQYLSSLPSPNGPTSGVIRRSDEDYEYEEIEVEDTTPPTPRTQQLSFFEAPLLAAIVEESDHTERSIESSIRSASISHRKSLEKMAEIREEDESKQALHNVVDEAGNVVTDPVDGGDHPSTTTIDPTMSDLERSMDIGEVFNLASESTPPGSPGQPTGQASALGRSSRRSSRREIGQSASNRHNEAQGEHLSEGSGNTGSRRKSSNTDDQSFGSSRKSESRRHEALGHRSFRRSKASGERQESDIQEFLSMSSSEKRRSLDSTLLSPSVTRRDIDDRSRLSHRSKSRDRGEQSSKSGDRDRRASKRPSTSNGSEPSSFESPKKGSRSRAKPTIEDQSKALDDFLSRIPEGPIKRGSARSTVSALIRSTASRKGPDRDTQSVVPSSGSGKVTRAPASRRVRTVDSDASNPSKGRSRSSSFGRKEHLRRSRQKEDQREEKALSRRSGSRRSASPISTKSSSRRSESPSPLKTSRRTSDATSITSKVSATSTRSASPSEMQRSSTTGRPPSRRSPSPSPRKSSSHISSSKPESRSSGRSKGPSESSPEHQRGKESAHRVSGDPGRASTRRSKSGKSGNGGHHSSTSLIPSHSEILSHFSPGNKSVGQRHGPSHRETPKARPAKRASVELMGSIPKLDDVDLNASFSREAVLGENHGSQDGSDHDMEEVRKDRSHRRELAGTSTTRNKSETGEFMTSPRPSAGDRLGSSDRRHSVGHPGGADAGDLVTPNSRRGRRVSRTQAIPPHLSHLTQELDLPPAMVSLAQPFSDVESHHSALSSGSFGNRTNGTYPGDLNGSWRRSFPSMPSVSLESPAVYATPLERMRELEKIEAFLTEEEYEQKKREILASI